MKHIPKRDISGKCHFGCRNRVREGQQERQLDIASQPYSEPLEYSPEWVRNRNDQPGIYGGRI
jgi:hypothetical protein